KDPDRGFREAIGLLEREPERVTVANWTALRWDPRYPYLMSSFPDEALWFSTGFPRGTVYEGWTRLNYLKTLRVVRLEDKAVFRQLAPYDYWVAWCYIWKLSGEKPSPDAIEREAGPLLEYDARLLNELVDLTKGDLDHYKQAGRRLADLDPSYWPDYA